mgnify:CR=1 FL=1
MTRSKLFVLSTLVLLGCATTNPPDTNDDVGTDPTGLNTGNTENTNTTPDVSATAPVAVDDSATTDEGRSVDFEILANDTDPNDAVDIATVLVTSEPANGTVQISPAGGARYTHDGSETLSDSFNYTVDDTTGETSNAATVSITIDPVNDPPDAIDDAFVIDENAVANMDLAVNDTDVDDVVDPASIAIASSPFYGTIAINPDGTVDYTHDGSEVAVDNFGYTINDLAGATSTVALVTVTINPINDAPIAVDDLGFAPPGGVGNVRLSNNDIDPDDGLDLSSIVIVAPPAHGTLVDNGDGTVDYTHDNGLDVIDVFTYTIDDPAGTTSNIATVDMEITNVPQGVCQGGSDEISTNVFGDMMLCDDPLDATCEEDFGQLCPVDWHLCTVDEFNLRNDGWTQPTDTFARALGLISCRGGGGAGHFTVPDSGSPNTELGQDESYNCWYGSSQPACSTGYGCNETQGMALCCRDSPSCGNGVVDNPEEACDDGNQDDSDDCLSSCAWRVPTAWGLFGTGC